MTINEKAEEYIMSKSDDNSSISEYRAKVRGFASRHKNLEVEEALTDENIVSYIFDTKSSSEKIYDALRNFYLYINNTDKGFPVEKREAIKADEGKTFSRGRPKKQGIIFFPDNFDLDDLLKDEYYTHLNNEKASITLKAIISIALSIGLDTGHINEGDSREHITINDINIISEKCIIVKCKFKGDTKKEISIIGDNCKYIYQYSMLRNKINDESDAFFKMIWSAKDINIDTKYSKRKPYTLQETVSYILNYIGEQLGFGKINFTYLRFNMVYRNLIDSKGAALHELVSLYEDYPPFIRQAFERYSKTIQPNYQGYNFFHKASSVENESKTEEAEIGSMLSIIERRIRDKEKVKQLKRLYDNRCQLCGNKINFENIIEYSEVHHIQPMGTPHNGIDETNNMIVLCPNHHKMFDLGLITIDPTVTNKILCVNEESKLYGEIIKVKHAISMTYIRYHYENIYLPLKKAEK